MRTCVSSSLEYNGVTFNELFSEEGEDLRRIVEAGEGTVGIGGDAGMTKALRLLVGAFPFGVGDLLSRDPFGEGARRQPKCCWKSLCCDYKFHVFRMCIL